MNKPSPDCRFCCGNGVLMICSDGSWNKAGFVPIPPIGWPMVLAAYVHCACVSPASQVALKDQGETP